MKKISLAALCLVLCATFMASQAWARTMTVINKSGAELVVLNVSKSGGDNTSNMLKKPLANGKSVKLSLDSGSEGWNVLGIDAKNEAHVNEDLSFAGKSKIIVGGGTAKVQ